MSAKRKDNPPLVDFQLPTCRKKAKALRGILEADVRQRDGHFLQGLCASKHTKKNTACAVGTFSEWTVEWKS